MKKTNRKPRSLRLDAETLRPLADHKLDVVQGALGTGGSDTQTIRTNISGMCGG
jgi:hypothetical protein